MTMTRTAHELWYELGKYIYEIDSIIIADPEKYHDISHASRMCRLLHTTITQHHITHPTDPDHPGRKERKEETS